MSARAAVYDLLTTDEVLGITFGIGPDQVFPTHSLDSPLRGVPFLIMRWEETTEGPGHAGQEEVLTVWCHMAKEDSTDYVPLIAVLKRVQTILTSVEHYAGEDGIFTCAISNGMSPDLDDPVFGTITKNAAFKVVSR